MTLSLKLNESVVIGPVAQIGSDNVLLSRKINFSLPLLKFNSASSQARLKSCWALTLVALDEKVHESSLHGQPDTPRQVEQHGLKPWTN